MIVVLICAGTEWRVVRGRFDSGIEQTPFGECFITSIDVCGVSHEVAFVHGGWGKIAAAASTQYAIDRFAPELIVNLGTCGGFHGEIEAGEVILCERTIVYDIIEQMGDPDAAIASFATEIDLDWLAPHHPPDVRRTLLVSADRDLVADEVASLSARYGAVAGDWESGAIAWVAKRNGVRCLILRGVSDLVGETGGTAYDGNIDRYRSGATAVMQRLVEDLPSWLAACQLK